MIAGMQTLLRGDGSGRICKGSRFQTIHGQLGCWVGTGSELGKWGAGRCSDGSAVDPDNVTMHMGHLLVVGASD